MPTNTVLPILVIVDEDLKEMVKQIKVREDSFPRCLEVKYASERQETQASYIGAKCNHCL